MAVRPEKPVLIYDAECRFCCYWIRRWQRITSEAIEYRALQDPAVRDRFPEIERAQLERAVHLVDVHGRVTRGAAAVFHSLNSNPRWWWPLALYCKFPRLARLSEAAYAFVAAHRVGFSRLTRLFWGVHAAPPGYELVAALFLRSLAIIYLVAFASLWAQADGLFGERGILPVHEYLSAATQYFDQQQVGLDRYRLLPAWFWLGDSDLAVHSVCAAGVLASLLLLIGIAPPLSAALLWTLYLSLVSVGREFLSFQWDALLLETGFLAIFLAPWQWRPRAGNGWAPSPIILLLFRWLLFRLMFESGCVKLLSGDPTWRNLTALTFHYETQPLPTWIGWHAHHWPALFQQACAGVMFGIELALPFLIFAPRRPRAVAAAGFAILQVWILLTGNYGFFNYLTLALCLLLLDDQALRRCWPGGARPAEPIAPFAPRLPRQRTWPVWVPTALALVLGVLTLRQLIAMFGGTYRDRGPASAVASWIAPFRIANQYGLFAVMTTNRPEIIIEGSNDGQTWKAYEFKFKPGDPRRVPSFVAPHQPRLDWQMWFAALGSYRENPWLVRFGRRLMEGAPPVLNLLRHNPFPDSPPRQIRAELYQYHLSSPSRRRGSEPVWWTRERLGEYLPPLSLPVPGTGPAPQP